MTAPTTTDHYRSVFRAGLFAGQTHVVTGGGSGIGRCIAHELASLGAHVVVLGRTQDKLERVCAEIAEDGGRASLHSVDIRDEDGVTRVVQQIVGEHGPVHGLVNNAGGQFPAPLSAISKKGFDSVVATNLTGAFLMSRELYKRSMATHGGSIVNIVADMWNGMPGMAHSGAARAGVVNLTQTAAVEWAGNGIRVNAVAPGWIASSGLDTYDNPMVTALLPQLRESVPLKRLGTEAEVSAAVVFLLSPAAAFITGTTLRVDGAAPIMGRTWPAPDHDRAPEYQGFHRYQVPRAVASMRATPSTQGED